MDQNFVAYIISYLPDDWRREPRADIHTRQVKDWLDNTDVKIKIVNMNYHDVDYWHLSNHQPNPRIEYMGDNAQRKLVKARNECLEDFYASSYKWMILMDNDASLYHGPKYNSGFDLIKEMSSQIDLYERIGLFYPHNPQTQGFNGTWNMDPKLYLENHVFAKGFGAKGTMCFMRNFKLYGEKPIWQEHDLYLADLAFPYELLKHGYPTFKCWNLIMKEMVPTGKLSFPGTNEDRAETAAREKQFIADFYGFQIRNGSWNTRDLVKRQWPAGIDKTIVVPKPGRGPRTTLVGTELFD